MTPEPSSKTRATYEEFVAILHQDNPGIAFQEMELRGAYSDIKKGYLPREGFSGKPVKLMNSVLAVNPGHDLGELQALDSWMATRYAPPQKQAGAAKSFFERARQAIQQVTSFLERPPLEEAAARRLATRSILMGLAGYTPTPAGDQRLLDHVQLYIAVCASKGPGQALERIQQAEEKNSLLNRAFTLSLRRYVSEPSYATAMEAMKAVYNDQRFEGQLWQDLRPGLVNRILHSVSAVSDYKLRSAALADQFVAIRHLGMVDRSRQAVDQYMGALAENQAISKLLRQQQELTRALETGPPMDRNLTVKPVQSTGTNQSM